MRAGRILFGMIIVIGLVAGCATLGTTNSKEARAHYKLGVAFLSENKVQEAYVEFHKSYDLNPDDKEVLNAIGIVYLIHLDDPQKSIAYFERAVREDPDYSEAYNNLGFAYASLGQFQKAIPFYRKALENPVYATAEKAYLNIGNACYRLGKYGEALSAYKEVVNRSPALSLGYMRLALTYNAMGRYGDAATALAQALKVDPAYNGDKDKFVQDLKLRKLKATDAEEQDIRDYLDILKY